MDDAEVYYTPKLIKFANSDINNSGTGSTHFVKHNIFLVQINETTRLSHTSHGYFKRVSFLCFYAKSIKILRNDER